MVTELRAAHRAGVTITVRGLKEAGRADLLAAVFAYGGGITRARRLAKIAAPPRVIVDPARPGAWSKAVVLADLRARHARQESLAASRVPYKLFRAGVVHLGSWRAAVEAIGLDYDDVQLVRGPRSAADICAELRGMRAEHPRMTWAELQQARVVRAAERRFGSLASALVAAGIDHWPKRHGGRTWKLRNGTWSNSGNGRRTVRR